MEFVYYNTNYFIGVSTTLDDDEVVALANSKNNKNVIIQKSDKVNSVVVTDRSTYTKRVRWMLSDQYKFIKVDVLENNFLKFSIDQAKPFDPSLKSFWDKEQPSADKYRFLKQTKRSKIRDHVCLK